MADNRRLSQARNHLIHAKAWLSKDSQRGKGARSLEEGIEFLRGFDIVVHPRCTHTIDELTMYSYKRDPLTGAVVPLLEDKNNHVIDALRYACEGARRTIRGKEWTQPIKLNNRYVV